MTDRLTVQCAKCGSTKFSLPTNPQASDKATCAGCGAVGRYGDLQKQSIDAARNLVEAAFKKAFKVR